MRALINYLFPISILRQSFADEGDGGTDVEAGSASSDGNPSGSGDEQHQPESGQETTEQGQEQSKDKAPAFTSEDLMNEARFSMSPAQEVEQLRTQISASSREGQRLKGNEKTLAKHLEKQGLALVLDNEGRFTGIKATEKYQATLPDISLSFSDLSPRQQDALADDPEKAFNAIAKQIAATAQEKIIRVLPTTDKVINDLSPERRSGVESWLTGRKGRDGEALYPEIGEDMPILRDQLNDPTLPQAIKDAYNSSPELMTELFLNRLMIAKQRLQSWHEAKQKQAAEAELAAKNSAGNFPAGEGNIHIEAQGEDRFGNMYID